VGAVGVPGAGLPTSVSLLAVVDASGCWYATIIFVRGIVVVISRRIEAPNGRGPRARESRPRMRRAFSRPCRRNVRVCSSRSVHWHSSSLSHCCCFRCGEPSPGFEWEGSATLELKELEDDGPAWYPVDPPVSKVTSLDLIAWLLGGWSSAGG
jgi:hypothetical protein